MRRVLLILLLAVPILGFAASPALACTGVSVDEDCDPPPDPPAGGQEGAESDGYTAHVYASYQDPIVYTATPSGSGAPAVACDFFFDLGPNLGYSTGFGWALAVQMSADLGTGNWYSIQIRCWYNTAEQPLVPGYPQFWDPPEPPFPPNPDLIEEPRLRAYAAGALPFDPAVPQISPAVDQVVGVPTWLAVTTQLDYDAITANAGPLWATARPVFRDVRWDMGDGSPEIVCERDSVAIVFDPDIPVEEQSTDCFHLYESNGDGAVVEMTITATMTWDIWASTSSAPVEQLITPITRQATFVVDVRELQAVID